MVHPRFAKKFAFHPPWGDCRGIGLIRASDPQERPPPPPDADESSLQTPGSYPGEKAKREKNALKRAKKAEKERAHEEENCRLLKDDVEKKKAEGKLKGRAKRKHDPSARKKGAPKKRSTEPTEINAESNSSDKDDPPPPTTREETDAISVSK